MALDPQGAALMVPSELLVLTCMGTTGWLGRNGARWAFLMNKCMDFMSKYDQTVTPLLEIHLFDQRINYKIQFCN